MGFSEEWYPCIPQLEDFARQTPKGEGLIIECGCWEGRSTVALANVFFPETLRAVDTWKGSVAMGEDFPDVVLAKQKNVLEIFKSNINELTHRNVSYYVIDMFEYLSKLTAPIKFIHIDAAHDYQSVKKAIQIVLPLMIKGGIMCGDDYANYEGVKRAVDELLPSRTIKGVLWGCLT